MEKILLNIVRHNIWPNIHNLFLQLVLYIYSFSKKNNNNLSFILIILRKIDIQKKNVI